jgi:ribonuclease P protein component
MLAKAARLRQGREIDRVYRQGRFGGAQTLTTKVIYSHRSTSRAVVVVAKKVSKKAVVRNRLRRRLSEILAKDWQQIKAGCDIVVTVTADSSDLTAVELESQLLSALKRAGALKA